MISQTARNATPQIFSNVWKKAEKKFQGLEIQILTLIKNTRSGGFASIPSFYSLLDELYS